MQNPKLVFIAVLAVYLSGPAEFASAQSGSQSGTYQVTTPANGPAYGGRASGTVITAPLGTLLTVVVDPPVAPGGPGTVPDSGGEFNGWNGCKSELTAETTDIGVDKVDAKTFAKLQTVSVRMNLPAPNEMHWECQGTATVGGLVEAQLTQAHGTCHAGGRSKTSVVYGGQTVVADKTEAIALSKTATGQVGGNVWVLGILVTYAMAGSEKSEKAIADIATGTQARATSAIIDYVQQGDMACSIRSASAQVLAKSYTLVEVKGSAKLTWTLVTGP